MSSLQDSLLPTPVLGSDETWRQKVGQQQQAMAAQPPAATPSSSSDDAPVAAAAEPSRPKALLEFLSPRERNMGIIGSIASVMNAVIGTGILALPVAFSRVGWALGTGLISFCALLTFVTLLALGHMVTEVGGVSYGNTMELILGRAASAAVSVIIAVYCWGICVVYSVVISANLDDLMTEQNLVTGKIIPGRFIENRQAYILFTTFGVLIPLCMLPNFDRLKYAAMFATSSMIYLTGVIAGLMFLSASRGATPVWEAGRELVEGAADAELLTPIGLRVDRVTAPLLHPQICCVPLYLVADGVSGCGPVGDEPGCCAAVDGEVCCSPDLTAQGILPWEGAVNGIFDENIFSSFSTFMFAFLTHTMVPQVCAELVEPSTPRLAAMMGGVCTGSLLLYELVGVAGYLMFGACVCDNISVSFGPSVMVAVGQGFVVLSVCTGYATLAWPCRDAVLELCYPLYLSRCCTVLPALAAATTVHYCTPEATLIPSDTSRSDGIEEKEEKEEEEGSVVQQQPSMQLKRVVSVLIALSASTVAWFDPPFGAVVAILGAVGASAPVPASHAAAAAALRHRA